MYLLFEDPFLSGLCFSEVVMAVDSGSFDASHSSLELLKAKGLVTASSETLRDSVVFAEKYLLVVVTVSSYSVSGNGSP